METGQYGHSYMSQLHKTRKVKVNSGEYHHELDANAIIILFRDPISHKCLSISHMIRYLKRSILSISLCTVAM